MEYPELKKIINELVNNEDIILKKEKFDIVDDITFWGKIKISNLTELENKIKYLLTEYGTKLPCNRFDIGNSIEFILGDHIRNIGYFVEELPNSKRIDLCINNNYNISIKYSSIGNITLHNSNSCINKDCKLTDLLLLTPSNLYLLTNNNLKENNIDINQYLINSGDSLKLKRNILKELEKKHFQYQLKIDINIDKKLCKNKLCSKVFYNVVMFQYHNNKIN